MNVEHLAWLEYIKRGIWEFKGSSGRMIRAHLQQLHTTPYQSSFTVPSCWA